MIDELMYAAATPWILIIITRYRKKVCCGCLEALYGYNKLKELMWLTSLKRFRLCMVSKYLLLLL
jgi:hypothetical protein